jgi:hypothetical protein
MLISEQFLKLVRINKEARRNFIFFQFNKAAKNLKIIFTCIKSTDFFRPCKKYFPGDPIPLLDHEKIGNTISIECDHFYQEKKQVMVVYNEHLE